MRSLPLLVSVVVSVLGVGLVSAMLPAGAAAADPVKTIFHLAPQDGGTGGGAPPPAPTAPLLGDVAGTPRQVSLPQLLSEMVASSPDLAQVRIDRQIAEIAVQKAQTWRDWQVEGNLTIASTGRGDAPGQAVGVDVGASISRVVSTGGVFSVGVDAAWDRVPAPTDDTEPTHVWQEAVTVAFAQPLLRGRGEKIVLATERASRHQVDANELAERAAAIAAVREVVLAYLDLVDAENNLEIQRSSLDLARERLRVTEAGIRAGGVAESETISVEQAIATREEGAMASELGVIQSSLVLRRLIGMAIGPGDVSLSSDIDLAVPTRQWDAAALLQQALDFSPELARLKALDAGAAIEVELNENNVLPRLDLSVSFGPHGVGTTVGAATKNLATFDDFSAVAILTYQQAIGQRAARADLRAAQARREKLMVTAEDIRRMTSEAISVAVIQVQVAERRVSIALRATKLAEKNLQVEQARLGLGRSRNVDVLIRQDELRAAQLRASQAVVDWHRAATAIAALTGELLPTYGIEIRR
jgi:outer membrane protein